MKVINEQHHAFVRQDMLLFSVIVNIVLGGIIGVLFAVLIFG